MEENKIGTSILLPRSMRQKLKRISNILNVTESGLMNDALEYYFSNSKITKEAMKRLTENDKFLQEIGATVRREIRQFGVEGYEFRPENRRIEEDE